MDFLQRAKSYAEEFLALATGDKQEVVAQRNFRLSSNIINGQISTLNSELVNLETQLEDAEREAFSALYNGGKQLKADTGSQREYLERIVSTEAKYNEVKEKYDDVQKSIQFWKTRLAILEKKEEEGKEA